MADAAESAGVDTVKHQALIAEDEMSQQNRNGVKPNESILRIWNSLKNYNK